MSEKWKKTPQLKKQGHSESAYLRHGSSIPGLSKPTISTDIAFFPPLFHTFADSDPDQSQFIFLGSRQWSRSLQKSNHLFLVPFRTYPENFIKIHPKTFLSYLSLKITFHGSRRSRWSGSLPKSNHFFLLPFRTYPENFIKSCPEVFELSCSQINGQTDGQTNPGENITALGEVITRLNF